ncbi:MAG TPA: hypothetical protein VJ044_19460 [Candidatus Hodarchaeales archaeon]|nr:hypothetical protein [Candidatus Hodarchaeales archaeon]
MAGAGARRTGADVLLSRDYQHHEGRLLVLVPFLRILDAGIDMG